VWLSKSIWTIFTSYSRKISRNKYSWWKLHTRSLQIVFSSRPELS